MDCRASCLVIAAALCTQTPALLALHAGVRREGDVLAASGSVPPAQLHPASSGVMCGANRAQSPGQTLLFLCSSLNPCALQRRNAQQSDRLIRKTVNNQRTHLRALDVRKSNSSVKQQSARRGIQRKSQSHSARIRPRKSSIIVDQRISGLVPASRSDRPCRRDTPFAIAREQNLHRAAFFRPPSLLSRPPFQLAAIFDGFPSTVKSNRAATRL